MNDWKKKGQFARHQKLVRKLAQSIEISDSLGVFEDETWEASKDAQFAFVLGQTLVKRSKIEDTETFLLKETIKSKDLEKKELLSSFKDLKAAHKAEIADLKAAHKEASNKAPKK